MRIRMAYGLAGIAPLALGGMAFAAPAMASPQAHAAQAVSPASTCRVPGVVFDPVGLAVPEIEDAGLVPIIRGPAGPDDFVNTQSPVAGRFVTCGSTVTIVTLPGPPP